MVKKIKKQFPPEQYGIWESDGDETYLSTSDTLETSTVFMEQNEVVEVAVYTFDKIIKVKKEASFKIIK